MGADLFAQGLIAIVSAFGAGAGVYIAMRVDIARAHLMAQMAHESAAEAHRRIDRLQA